MHRSLSPLTKTALTLMLVTGAMLAAAQQPKRAAPITPGARLAAAKTALVRKVMGSSIPYNVIVSSLEGWGRFKLVDAPEEADIILEISAPDEGGGVSISSSTKKSAPTGRTDLSSSTTNRQISMSHVRVIVYDGKSKVALWSGTEQPKFAMKQRAREDSLVEAAQRLVSKFRDRVEPPPAQ